MKNVIIIFLLLFSIAINAQDSTVVLSVNSFDKENTIELSKQEGWVFKSGNDPSWADKNLNTSDWKKLKPTDFTEKMAYENGKLEGWFRIKIKLDSTLQDSIPGIGLRSGVWAASDVYINGKLFHSFGNTGRNNTEFKEYNANNKLPILLSLDTNEEYTVAIHFSDKINQYDPKKKLRADYGSLLTITSPNYTNQYYTDTLYYSKINLGVSVFLLALMLLFWLIYFQNKEEKHLLAIALTVSFLLLSWLDISLFFETSFGFKTLWDLIGGFSFISFFTLIPFTVGIILKNQISKFHKVFASTLMIIVLFCTYIDFYSGVVILILVGSSAVMAIYYIISSRKIIKGARWAVVIGLLLNIGYSLFMFMLEQAQITRSKTFDSFSLVFALTIFPIGLLVYVSMWFKETRKLVEDNARKVLQVSEEKKELLESQNIVLEKQVTERTKDLNQSLENLKATQSQLIQSEKMASLGELTAGIAHEIQNPLNFVNNFSEVSNELIEEATEELVKTQHAASPDKAGSEYQEVISEALTILADVKQNLEKIHHHGKRADAIVKGMLAHSRSSSGEKIPTNINALADEYLRLSYHGLRAKDKTFNADFSTDFDPDLPKVNVIPQDIGRVLLNLINNAFQAASETENPKVTVKTRGINSTSGDLGVQITVSDNGPGIPDSIKDKIFQPFFTTKPTGEGTGLGLSLSYDIVKAHGGWMEINSVPEKTTFTIHLEKRD